MNFNQGTEKRKRAKGDTDMSQTICCCCPAAGYIQSLGIGFIILGVVRVILYYTSDSPKSSNDLFYIGFESIVIGLILIIVVCLEFRILFLVLGVTALLVSVGLIIMIATRWEKHVDDFKTQKVPNIIAALILPLTFLMLFMCAYAAFTLGCSGRDYGGKNQGDEDVIAINCQKSPLTAKSPSSESMSQDQSSVKQRY